MAGTADQGGQQASGKICTVCGIDVNGRPRVKDAQGRYVCKDCFDKAKAAKSASQPAAPAPKSAAPADGDNSFLLSMGGAAAATGGMKPCPECGRALNEKAVVCTGCGLNIETGKRLKIKVTKEKAPKEKSSGSSDSILQNPAAIGLGLLLVSGGLIGAAFFSEPMWIVAVVFAGVLNIVAGIWTVVEAFRDETICGVLILIGRFSGFLYFYELYYVFIRNENTTLKWVYAVSLISVIGSVVANPAILRSLTMGP